MHDSKFSKLLAYVSRGVATGDIGIYPPKSAQVNFIWGKNDIRTAIQQLYTPQKQISGYAPVLCFSGFYGRGL